MVTRAKREIDFSTFPDSDGEPMAETDFHRVQMTDLIYALAAYLPPERAYVAGNMLVYYNPRNGWDHLAPDVFVAFGIPRYLREKYLVWEEGLFPQLVVELTSSSTWRDDLGTKRALYGRLGVQEYYLYDPQRLRTPVLQAFRAEEGELRPVSVQGDGVTSPLLGADLRLAGPWLRLVDPRTGLPVPVPEELAAAAQQEAVARAAAEEARAQMGRALQEALETLARLRQEHAGDGSKDDRSPT